MNSLLLKKLTANVSVADRVSGAIAVVNNNQDLSKSLVQEDLEELDVFLNEWLNEPQLDLDEKLIQEILGLRLLVETIVEMNSLY